jgi:hypothetical protein
MMETMETIGEGWRRRYWGFQTTGTTRQLTTKPKKESDQEADENTERRS